MDWAVANGDIDEIVADDTAHNIPYDSVDVAPNSVCFQVGSTGTLKPIDIVQNGWYMFYLEAWPGGVGNAGVFTVGLSVSGGGFLYNSSYSAGGLFARRSHYDNGSTSILLGKQETFGPFYVQATARIGGFVYHALDSAGVIDWNYGTLTVVSLGAGLGLETGADMAPNGDDGDEQFRTYF